MSLPRTLYVTKNDVPKNDLSLQILLRGIEKGMKIPIINNDYPEEKETLHTLYTSIERADYEKIISLSKDPLFHQRLLRLRLGFMDRCISEDQFRTLMMMSYLQAENLQVEVASFRQTEEKGEFSLSAVGKSWLQAMNSFSNKEEKMDAPLLEKINNYPISENKIIIAYLDIPQIVATCLASYQDNSKIAARLLPVINYFEQQQISLKLKNGMDAKEIYTLLCNDSFFRNATTFTTFKNQFINEYPLQMFYALIRALPSFEPIVINKRPCLLFASSSLLRVYLNVVNPDNKVTYVDTFGPISPVAIESHGRADRRVGNLFIDGLIDNPKVAHHWITSPAWYFAHDFYYHFRLTAQLRPKMRKQLFRSIDSIRTYTSMKSLSSITHSTWIFTDQESTTGSLQGQFNKAFEDKMFPERCLLLTDIVLNRAKWNNLDTCLERLNHTRERLKDIKRYYKETKSQEKTAALIYLNYDMNLPNEADLLSQVSNHSPHLDWIKWKKVFSPHNCLYPILQFGNESIALYSEEMKVNVNLKRSFNASEATRIVNTIVNQRMPKNYLEKSFNGQLVCGLSSLMMEYKKSANDDVLMLKNMSNKENLYDELRTKLTTIKNMELKRELKKMLLSSYQDYLLELMHNMARKLFLIVDKMKIAAGADELSTIKPIIGSQSRFNFFHFHNMRKDVKTIQAFSEAVFRSTNAEQAATLMLATLESEKTTNLGRHLKKLIQEDKIINTYLNQVKIHLNHESKLEESSQVNTRPQR